MTSMPVIMLATIGLMRPGFPESTHLWFGLTPGAALSDVVRVGWFGRTTELASNEAVGFAGTWVEVAPALGSSGGLGRHCGGPGSALDALGTTDLSARA